MAEDDSRQYDFAAIKLLRMQDNCHGNLPFFARMYDASGVTKEMHGHEYTQINYIENGYCCHAYGDIVHDMSEGDVFVVPPFVPHRIIVDDNVDLHIIEIEFNTELVTQECSPGETSALLLDFLFLEPYLMSSERGARTHLNLSGANRERIERLMKEIISEFQDRADGFELLIKTLIINLALKIGRVYQNHSSAESRNPSLESHRRSIAAAIAYIEENYQEKLCVDDVARIAMLSTSYFCYIFKSITHRTFVEYVNDLRVHKSIELLNTSQMNVGEICFAVGFNNISYFNRLFKQYTGSSPSVYRITKNNLNQ